MNLPNTFARCEGAASNSPEAALCRRCARTQPSGWRTPSVEPMVRMMRWTPDHSSPVCPNHIESAPEETV